MHTNALCKWQADFFLLICRISPKFPKAELLRNKRTNARHAISHYVVPCDISGVAQLQIYRLPAFSFCPRRTALLSSLMKKVSKEIKKKQSFSPLDPYAPRCFFGPALMVSANRLML
jgi:hypothetical protein